MGRDRTVISRTVVLAHPVAEVFGAVMSPEIAPSIDPAVRQWKPDTRPIGVDTEFTIRGRFQWLPIRGRSRVTVWDPPNRGEFTALSPTWPISTHAVHTFEALGEETRYTWALHVGHPNPIGRLAVRLLRPLVERTIEDQNRTLAAWLDEHPGHGSAAAI